MTTTRVLRVLRRLWFVVATGLAVTALTVALVHVQRRTWFGEMDVRFFIPVSQANPNVIRASSSTLVQVAAIVRGRVDHGHLPPGSTLSLTVQGGPDRSQVSLPNTGSQFVPIYSQPLLHLEATAPTEAAVQRQLRSLARQVQEQTLRLQVEEAVAVVNQITTQNEPLRPQVVLLDGHTSRAEAVIAVLGTAITAWLTVELNRWIRRRRRHLDESAQPRTI